MPLVPADRADRHTIDGHRVCEAIEGIGETAAVQAWAQRFALLADPRRLSLLLALRAAPDLCVSDLHRTQGRTHHPLPHHRRTHPRPTAHRHALTPQSRLDGLAAAWIVGRDDDGPVQHGGGTQGGDGARRADGRAARPGHPERGRYGRKGEAGPDPTGIVGGDDVARGEFGAHGVRISTLLSCEAA